MISSKQSTLKICNETIYPGESVSLALPLPELYSCLPAYMPIKVFHGKKPGPILVVFAAVRGNEVNGTEIINRLVNIKQLNRLHGTLIAIPAVNVFGLVNRSQFLPGHVDLYTNFPGSAEGTHADRIAHLFVNEIFNLADYAIALETGPLNYSDFPEIFIDPENPSALELARKFGTPVITQMPADLDTLQAYANSHGKLLLTYSAGEASRFEPKAIKMGLKGIINVMRHLKMLTNKESELVKVGKTFILNKLEWVRTSFSGISANQVSLGTHVHPGSVLSIIRDPFGNTQSQHITSPKEGIVIGINNVPLVKEGEALFKIGSFAELEKAESHLKNWQ